MSIFRPVPLGAAAALAVVLAASPAASRTITDGWPLLAFDRDQGCELAIVSSGKTMQITARGLLPGERVRLHIDNAGMKPIDWRVLASRDGAWSQIYVPFLWHRSGGTVSVRLEGSTCSLSASAPWSREFRVIP